ncbi:hypothetical protein FQA39_LY12889 [Lamprigera yunnana]|nr:hypothetical protein FQA39_LY12889 [Lamprigera yunnana]
MKKSTVEKMFGMMLPKGPDGLKLSQMNMGGMGKSMMLGVMKKKQVMKVQELLNQFIALDGNSEEELIDGVEFAGVAKYLNEATNAYSNLFI